MHPSLLLLLLLLTFTVPPLSTATHESRFNKGKCHLNDNNPNNITYREYFEITRPSPLSILTPSCTFDILSYDFGDTIGLPPTSTPYSPPPNCTWSHAIVRLSAASNGSQYNRIAAVWLDGIELLRTSTAEPTRDGVFWNVVKDVTKYSSLLFQEDLTLSVMLENIIDDVHTGVYQLKITFLYYDVDGNDTTGVDFPFSPFPLDQKSTMRKLKESSLSSMLSLNYEESSLGFYKKPADLIIPISDFGDEGFWYRIENDSDVKRKGIQIPLNTYKAVIEVYVSFHGNDEFWYSNPPDEYIEQNNLTITRGHGAYREIFVMLDENVVGSVIPFPVIFTGGINPLFWEPIVSIGAFNLPSYDIDLTPFLGMLLDGKEHNLGLSVADAISFWLIDANLHLWLDDNVAQVQAGTIKYSAPSSNIERKSKFKRLDGSFKIEGKRKNEFSSWVNSSTGNLTTHVYEKVKFENKIKFSKSGSEKVVKQKVKVETQVIVESETGIMISSFSVKRKYPLKVSIMTLAGSDEGTNSMLTAVEHSVKEEKLSGNFSSSLINDQHSSGWMVVQKDHDVLSGTGNTHQNYTYKDNIGCYSRVVSAANGNITNDATSLLCPPSYNSI